MEVYNRTREQLESYACKWWPKNIEEMESATSIIPILIKSQDKFISILKLSNNGNIQNVFEIIKASKFPANLFLKHLMVLADFGSEPLQRINKDFISYFPNRKLDFCINGENRSYVFQVLPIKGLLSNAKMRTDIVSIRKEESLTPFFEDLIMLLLYGSNSISDELAHIFEKCTVGNLIGNVDELKEYIKQRYIFVSRITGGARANGLGNDAELYAKKYIESRLDDSYIVESNGHIPGISQNDRTETTFDLCIQHNNKYVGIEISFQVTTNSVIERKAGQAQARYEAVSKTGNYVAYIIDGAGNFQRESALTTICKYSHCTVAYTDKEFDILIQFIKEKLK